MDDIVDYDYESTLVTPLLVAFPKYKEDYLKFAKVKTQTKLQCLIKNILFFLTTFLFQNILEINLTQHYVWMILTLMKS